MYRKPTIAVPLLLHYFDLDMCSTRRFHKVVNGMSEWRGDLPVWPDCTCMQAINNSASFWLSRCYQDATKRCSKLSSSVGTPSYHWKRTFLLVTLKQDKGVPHCWCTTWGSKRNRSLQGFFSTLISWTVLIKWGCVSFKWSWHFAC